MNADSASDAARLGKRSWWALGTGVVLLGIGVVLSLMDALSLVSTVAAVAGVTAIMYGLVAGVQVVLGRAPDE